MIPLKNIKGLNDTQKQMYLVNLMNLIVTFMFLPILGCFKLSKRIMLRRGGGVLSVVNLLFKLEVPSVFCLGILCQV